MQRVILKTSTVIKRCEAAVASSTQRHLYATVERHDSTKCIHKIIL